MAKKHAADNSNEEVQPLPPLEAASQEDSDPKVIIPEIIIDPVPVMVADDNHAKGRDAAKAQLESESVELKTALEKAKKRERNLQENLEQANQTERLLQEKLEQANQTERILQESMEQAKQRERTLQENIYQLQADVSEQKTQLQKLKKNADQVNSLKTELDQAKKTALELAKANGKLLEEMSALKQDKEKGQEKEKEKVQEKVQAIVPKTPIYKNRIVRPIQTGEVSHGPESTWLLD